jgi:hypothetical protein
MTAYLETFIWRDAKGNTAATRYFVGGTNSVTSALNIMNAQKAITNAFLQAAHGPLTLPAQEVVYGAAADYRDVEDKAVFTFQDAFGGIHRFQVPAPIAGIFLPDGETVDITNTLVVAYVSAVQAGAFTRDDQPIGFGAVGFRIRKKMHRRFTVFTKNPNLSGPGE